MKQIKSHILTVCILCSLFFVIEGNAQHLESLINVALTNNPEIQKFELRYKIASEKINEVNTIPNTEFGVGYFISTPETRIKTSLIFIILFFI